MDSRQALKLVLTNVFRKRGGNGIRTKLFEEFNQCEQSFMLAESNMAEGEEPVLACLLDPEHWVLITTDRVTWQEGTNNLAFELKSLVSARPSEVDSRDKHDWKFLRCSTSQGETFTIQFEPGPPFIAVWNVLKHIADHYRSPSS